MRPVTKQDLLREVTEGEPEHPLEEFRFYVKHKVDGYHVLRFDNGYGALVNLERQTVTAISWRPEAKHITDYYDVSGEVHNAIFGYLELIRGWGSTPPPF